MIGFEADIAESVVVQGGEDLRELRRITLVWRLGQLGSPPHDIREGERPLDTGVLGGGGRLGETLGPEGHPHGQKKTDRDSFEVPYVVHNLRNPRCLRSQRVSGSGPSGIRPSSIT
jgi:hypothetical protein